MPDNEADPFAARRQQPGYIPTMLPPPVDPYGQQQDPYAVLTDPFAARRRNPNYLTDIQKTAAPSLLRGGVAAVTGVPSMADLAAKGVSWGAGKLQPGVISPETAQKVQAGSEAFQQRIEPATYGSVMKGVQEGMPSIGFKGTGPLYEAKTGPGKAVEAALEIAPSAFTGPAGIVPRLTRPIEKIGRSILGGVGAAAGGELAEAYGPEGAKPWGQAIGGIGGAAFGPAAIRKSITPFPATPEHTAAVETLKGAGMKGLTAAQVSGSPRLAQIEANLSGDKLAAKDTAAFTQAVASKAGMPGAVALTPAEFQKAEANFKAYNDTVRNTLITPPNFATMHQEIGDIRKDAYKAMHGDIENIDSVIADLKGSPGAMGMVGSRYQYLRQKIQGMLGDKSVSGTEKRYLSEMRQALDAAMEKELPTSLSDQHKAYANYEILKNTKLDKNRQLTPEALHKSISGQWGEEAYNLGRGMSPLAAAGERVLPRPPAKEGPGRITQALSTLIGGTATEAYNPTEAIVGAILGKEMAPVAQGGGRFLSRPAYFNPMVQALLKNQLVPPSPGTMINAPMATRMLRGPIAGPIANQSQQ